MNARNSPLPDPAEANRPLRTRRLDLEPLTEAHASELWERLQDPALYAFVPLGPPADVSSLATRYRSLSSRRSPDGTELWLNWVGRDRRSGAAVGTFEATVGSETAAIAYLVFRDRWHLGYGREAVAAVVDRLFDVTTLPRVRAEIDDRNARSVALVRALGFVDVAHVVGADQFGGVRSDEVHLVVTRESWRRASELGGSLSTP